MTAVANPPTFSQISRPAWGPVDGSSMNADDARGMFMTRKTLSRSNSSSSVSSNLSNSTTSTVLSNGTSSQTNGTPLSSTTDLTQWSSSSATASRRKPRNGQGWPASKGEVQTDFSRLPAAGRQNGMIPQQHGQMQPGPNQQQQQQQQQQMSQQGMMARPMQGGEGISPAQPTLYLLSLNGTFERKTIAVPFAPESLRIGRQTNQKTIPTAANGFFDSKVLSRQHAEVYAERNGKIYIRDVKSSNGTFVNGARLSQENRESEPHELSTGDHLELGIDIVSEDQKTVVHHKVAAKVEHAGFMNSSSNVLDMNFGDLDPANSSAMMGAGGPMHTRGRAGNNMPAGNNNRMFTAAGTPNSMGQQRPFFLSPVATDQILKKLSNEMRNARLQAQDLGRANQFIGTLLSKNDIKDLDKAEVPEPPRQQMHMVNGGLPFRPDPKARFSEPPAPPPQQPLPEKPNVLPPKRGVTKPGSPAESMSPIRQENTLQIIQLTEALNSARKDIDIQTARMRELETLLQQEREARVQEREARALAEDQAKHLEESTAVATHMNGSADLVPDTPKDVDTDVTRDISVENSDKEEASKRSAAETNLAAQTAAALQAHIDRMENQVKELKRQADDWKQRAEAAEAEREADRTTLAEMVTRLREEEAKRVAAEKEGRSRSRRRASKTANDTTADQQTSQQPDSQASDAQKQPIFPDGERPDGDAPINSQDLPDESSPLSRGSTITSLNPGRTVTAGQRQLQAGLPYASALGVMLLGMGLMAYINGWQAPPPRAD